MRPGTTSEAEQAVVVPVQLADGVGSLLQTPTGTLLCGSETQTILSLGQCVDVLKCKSMWTPDKGFTLTHPKHGCIYAKTDEGTPLIPEAVALSLIAEIEQKVINSIKTICTTEVVKSTQKPANQPTEATASQVGKSSGSDARSEQLGQDPEVKRLAHSCMNIIAEAMSLKVDQDNLPLARAALMETVLLSEPRDLFKEIAEAIPTETSKMRFVSTGDAFKLLENIKLLKEKLSCVILVKALHVKNQSSVIRMCAVKAMASVPTPAPDTSGDDTTTAHKQELIPKQAEPSEPQPPTAMASSADSSKGPEQAASAATGPAREEESLALSSAAAAAEAGDYPFQENLHARRQHCPKKAGGGSSVTLLQGLHGTSIFILLWRSSKSPSISTTRRNVRAACIC
jgi:hypothetical protein